MTETSRPRKRSFTQHTHEIFFSLNIGFLIMNVVFWKGPDTLVSWLFRLNSSISIALHIEQTDLAMAHFVFFIFGISLALCVWILLHICSHTQLVHEILRSVSGLAAIAALPVMQLWGRPAWWWRYGWNRWDAIPPIEVASILLFAVLYLFHNRLVPAWGGAAIFGFHFLFWFRELGVYPFWFGTGIPITWLASTCSGLSWAFYVQKGECGFVTPHERYVHK